MTWIFICDHRYEFVSHITSLLFSNFLAIKNFRDSNIFETFFYQKLPKNSKISTQLWENGKKMVPIFTPSKFIGQFRIFEMVACMQSNVWWNNEHVQKHIEYFRLVFEFSTKQAYINNKFHKKKKSKQNSLENVWKLRQYFYNGQFSKTNESWTCNDCLLCPEYRSVEYKNYNCFNMIEAGIFRWSLAQKLGKQIWLFEF